MSRIPPPFQGNYRRKGTYIKQARSDHERKNIAESTGHCPSSSYRVWLPLIERISHSYSQVQRHKIKSCISEGFTSFLSLYKEYRACYISDPRARYIYLIWLSLFLCTCHSLLVRLYPRKSIWRHVYSLGR